MGIHVQHVQVFAQQTDPWTWLFCVHFKIEMGTREITVLFIVFLCGVNGCGGYGEGPRFDPTRGGTPIIQRVMGSRGVFRSSAERFDDSPTETGSNDPELIRQEIVNSPFVLGLSPAECRQKKQNILAGGGKIVYCKCICGFKEGKPVVLD